MVLTKSYSYPWFSQNFSTFHY